MTLTRRVLIAISQVKPFGRLICDLATSTQEDIDEGGMKGGMKGGIRHPL